MLTHISKIHLKPTTPSKGRGLCGLNIMNNFTNNKVETMINKNDVWHGEKRSQTTFHAPIDGYYHIGVKMMDESYTGDTEYVEYNEAILV